MIPHRKVPPNLRTPIHRNPIWMVPPVVALIGGLSAVAVAVIVDSPAAAVAAATTTTAAAITTTSSPGSLPVGKNPSGVLGSTSGELDATVNELLVDCVAHSGQEVVAWVTDSRVGPDKFPVTLCRSTTGP